jgi:putative hemolysin
MLMALQMSEQRAEFVTVLVLTPIIFIFAEVVPKNLFRRDADVLMYRVARALRISDLAFRATGAVALLRAMARSVARCVGFGRDRPLSTLEPRQQIAAMFREGVGTGILSDAQSDILQRVMNLSHVRVRSAMIPRDAVRTVPVDIDGDGFVELARAHNCSRMPVMAGPDKVVGVINVFDVLLSSDPTDRPLPPIADTMSPPLTLSPDQSVKTALTAMQRRATAMAVVVDRRERFLGIVTLKDLIEEIVGDLEAW